jgi:hypothetical protein
LNPGAGGQSGGKRKREGREKREREKEREREIIHLLYRIVVRAK